MMKPVATSLSSALGGFALFLLAAAPVIVAESFENVNLTQPGRTELSGGGTLNIQNNVVTAALGSTNNSVSVHLHGATIVSWISDAHEKLYVPKDVVYNGSTLVYGGMPLAFPRFANVPRNSSVHALPWYGFAANSTWELAAIGVPDAVEKSSFGIYLNFTLTHDSLLESYREAFPYKFKITYTVTVLSYTLKTRFSVMNLDDKPMDFQFLQYTLLRVEDARKVTVFGLQNSPYRDHTQAHPRPVLQETVDLNFTQEVDRTYFPRGRPIENVISLREMPEQTPEGFASPKTLINVVRQTDTLTDMIIWNPGPDGDITLQDNEYLNFVAIKPGAFATWPRVHGLPPNTDWVAAVKYEQPYTT